MAKFTPDDSVIKADTGKARIKAALDEHRKKHGEMTGVVTSRDPGMNDLLFDLRREDMPPDFEQYQLPVKLEGPGVLFFLTVVQPGGIVPTHRHARDLFRVVVSGSIILQDGRELKATDWMFVPAGTEYSFRGGLNPGAIIYHCYG
jgi:quercetin dioxygenase-like cupin family protein